MNKNFRKSFYKSVEFRRLCAQLKISVNDVVGFKKFYFCNFSWDWSRVRRKICDADSILTDEELCLNHFKEIVLGEGTLEEKIQRLDDIVRTEKTSEEVSSESPENKSLEERRDLFEKYVEMMALNINKSKFNFVDLDTMELTCQERLFADYFLKITTDSQELLRKLTIIFSTMRRSRINFYLSLDNIEKYNYATGRYCANPPNNKINENMREVIANVSLKSSSIL